MNKKNNIFNQYAGFLENPLGTLMSIMNSIDSQNKKEARLALFKKLGIELQDNLLGSDLLGINYKYCDIEVKNNFLYCFHDEEIKIDLYDITGKFLFSGRDIKQIEDKWFLVEVMDEEEDGKKFCKLMSLDGFVSEHYYRGVMDSKFTSEGYAILAAEEKNDKSDRKYKKIIVNKEGKEIFVSDSFSYPYIYGNVMIDDKNLYNLLTGEIICQKYSSSIHSKNHIIFQSYDKKFDGVVMLNILTCETKLID